MGACRVPEVVRLAEGLDRWLGSDSRNYICKRSWMHHLQPRDTVRIVLCTWVRDMVPCVGVANRSGRLGYLFTKRFPARAELSMALSYCREQPSPLFLSLREGEGFGQEPDGSIMCCAALTEFRGKTAGCQ